jgi:putative ABC transport system permease protein
MQAAGRSEAEADDAAERDLRAWLRVSPPNRDRPRRPMTGTALDLRHAWRLITWRPGFALAVMLLVAIAVATTTTITAVLYGVLFRPLPYPMDDRLTVIWQREQGAVGQVSFPDYVDLRASGVFDQTAALSGGRGTFSGGVSTERVNALEVEPAALIMLGATPTLGRRLDERDRAQPVAVISHRLWQTQFGAAPDAVGRSFSLSGRTLTIIGVLQPGFDFELPVASTFLLENHDVWLPFDAADLAQRRDVATYEVLARLAPGVSREAAQTAVSTVAASLAATHPATNAGRTFEVVGLRDHVVSVARRPLWLMAGGALILVMAALANLGGLVLARFATRRGELAVRAALGATRPRLARQLLTEHAVLAGLGGAFGTVAGWWGTRLLTRAEALNLPRPEAVVFDAPVLAAGALCIVTIVVLLSWLPLRSAALNPGTDMQTRVAGRSSGRPRRLLVAAEVAIALTLCTTAALVSLTLIRLLSLDPGFSSTNRITMRVSAYAARHPGKVETIGFFTELLERSSQ